MSSYFRYEWGSIEELQKILESKGFLQFCEEAYTDLLSFYDMANGLSGIITPDALNSAIAYSGSVRHELTMIYEAMKVIDDYDREAYEDFKARKEIEVRKRENRSDLAGTKWLAQSEIAKYAKMENYDEYKEYRDLSTKSHNKCRAVLRLLENLKLKSDDLRTISNNARTEMNNINIDAYTLSLEENALKEIQDKQVVLEASQRRRRRTT